MVLWHVCHASWVGGTYNPLQTPTAMHPIKRTASLGTPLCCLFGQQQSLVQGGSTGDDLNELARNHGLARAVEDQRQAVDHVRRVVGGVLHGRHARALLAGRRLEHRVVDVGRKRVLLQLWGLER